MVSINRKKIIEVVNKIKEDKEVIAVLLFGSFLRNKDYARDADLCVVMSPELKDQIMAHKRLKFLSIVPDKFDIQIFQLLPLYVRIQVLKEGKILYLKDEKKIYDLTNFNT